MNEDVAPRRGVAGGMSPWGSAVTRLHQFQGEHPDVQFSSPVMGRYGQYTALVPPGAIPGEAREITVTNPDLCSLMDELDDLFGSQGAGLDAEGGRDDGRVFVLDGAKTVLEAETTLLPAGLGDVVYIAAGQDPEMRSFGIPISRPRSPVA